MLLFELKYIKNKYRQQSINTINAISDTRGPSWNASIEVVVFI